MTPLSPEQLLERYARLTDRQKAHLAAVLEWQLTPATGVEVVSEGALHLIERIPLFRALEPGERRATAERLTPVRFGAGAFMTQQGMQDDCLYLLAEGEAEVRTTVEGSNLTVPVGTLGPGDFFGEMALLTGEPRRASVIARTAARCYRLDKADFDLLLRQRPEIIDGLSAVIGERLAEHRAARQGRLDLLGALSEEERRALLPRLRNATCPAGTVIMEQGAREAWMFLVVRGEAEVRVRADNGGTGASRTLATLRAGDFFGEMALLAGEVRRATVVARTRVDGFILDRDGLDEVIRQHPSIRESLTRVLSQREREHARGRTALEADRKRQHEREASVARRIRRFFAADLGARTGGATLAAAPARMVAGRLLFEYPTASGEDRPLHEMAVELWHHGMVDVFLGCATTGRDGGFEIGYDPAAIGGPVDLELRVQDSEHTYTPQGTLRLTNCTIFTVPGPKRTAAARVDLGDLRVPFWEYDPAAVTPRVLVVDQGDPPEAYAPGRSLVLMRVVAPLEIARRKHLLEHSLNTERPTLERIQQDYPENLTRRLERERPGYTRSDEYFGERILNGMGAGVIDQDDGRPGWYRIYHHWNSYEHDGEHALPNVDMRFEIRNERLFPVQITLGLRAPGATAPGSQVEMHTCTPADGDRWLQAKRIARVSAALVAELDNHLVSTHLNLEQYAVAARRNLRRNPVRYLLFPHLREVTLINRSADTFLLGPTGYITRASALTDGALRTRIRQVFGTLDWKNWRPLEPICATHHYAMAANLFWEVATEYVDEFFLQHEEDIVDQWHEVRLFSEDLVEHSVPDFLCSFLNRTVAGRPPDQRGWFSAGERMDVDVPRYVVQGIPRAVQPITLTDLPGADDIANLKQVCRYILHHAAFRHSWANSRQYDDGGEVLYNCLGLRYGARGPFAPESDHSIAPPPDRATELLWISCWLSRAMYGFITRNEENDIHPALLEALERRREAFLDLGMDIDTIQSRINL